jgi:hypothetical protein
MIGASAPVVRAQAIRGSVGGGKRNRDESGWANKYTARSIVVRFCGMGYPVERRGMGERRTGRQWNSTGIKVPMISKIPKQMKKRFFFLSGKSINLRDFNLRSHMRQRREARPMTRLFLSSHFIAKP